MTSRKRKKRKENILSAICGAWIDITIENLNLNLETALREEFIQEGRKREE